MYPNFHVVSMEPFTLVKWMAMAVWATKPTNVEPLLVPDTVMLNAPMTWNGSVVKPTAKNGPHQTVTKMQELDIMAHAVLKWTSGRQTWSLKPTLLTHAPSKMLTDVKVLNVVTMPAAKGKINLLCFIIDHILASNEKLNLILSMSCFLKIWRCLRQGWMWLRIMAFGRPWILWTWIRIQNWYYQTIYRRYTIHHFRWYRKRRSDQCQA